jgi:hypothetical protein
MSSRCAVGYRPFSADTIEEIRSLEAALERAGQLVSDDYLNVAIKDGKGNEISGDDMITCYLGAKKLMPNLRAVDVP